MKHQPAVGTMDVGTAFGPATERTNRILFPFNLSVWLVLSLIVFLESCSGAPTFNFQFPQDAFRDGATGVQNSIADFLANPIYIALALVGIMVAIVIAVIGNWLASRGTMMFIRAVATGDHDLGVNWQAVSKPATSLFVFQVMIIAITVIPLVALFVFFVASARVLDAAGALWFVLAVLGFVLFLLLLLAAGIISSLTRNLVAPLMWRFDLSWKEGWRLFRTIVEGGNLGQVLLFFVIRTTVGFFLGILAFFLGVFTCCVGFLPLVSQFLLLWLHVWERSFGLATLETLGPDFSMFTGLAPHDGHADVDNPSCARADDEPHDGI